MSDHDNYLKHYNKNHDPDTGRFAESPRSARTIARDLKRNEKRRFKAQAKAFASRAKADVYWEGRVGRSGRPSALEEKHLKNEKKYKQQQKEAEAITKQLIKEAKDAGYTVDTIKGEKTYISGKVVAGGLVAGPFGAVAMTILSDDGTSTFNKYSYDKYVVK